MSQYFVNNEVLQSIFSETDPNVIAETLLNELSIIIECIAPSKKIQCNSSYAPWIKEEFLREAKVKDNLHKIAKRYNREEDWRNFRAQRNLVNKINKANKSKYYNFRLDIDPKDNGGEEKYNNEV